MKPMTINLKRSWIPLQTVLAKGISRITSTFFLKRKKKAFAIFMFNTDTKLLFLNVCL